ncbi:MAG: CBS domain-containing protein [Desulfurococcales archaeon]|nr:CBS domain-containing protein [Desulfurococcales archaeon]
MRVRSFLNSSYPSVKLTDLLTSARARLRDYALRMLPAVDDERRLKGVVTRTTILALSSTRSNALVRDVVDNPKLVFRMNEDLRKAYEAMIEFDEWFVPVVNDTTGKYVGVLTLDRYLKEVLASESRVHSINVSEFMSEEVIYFMEDDPVSKVWRKMMETGFGGFPVVKGKKEFVVGIITQHDLLKKGYTRIELESEGGPRHGPKVKEAMTSPAITVKATSTLKEAISLMLRHDVGRLPVVRDDGSLAGIIDRSDAVRAYLPHLL